MTFPHIVVLIPGITGSVLEKDGKQLWGPSVGTVVGTALSRGGRLDALVLQRDSNGEEADDGVVATRLVPDVHIVPGLWKIDGYGKVADRLKRNLKLEPGVNYFEFPYDWRRDNRVAARALQRSIADWLRRRRASAPDAGVVIVAHSMGGLVARYFIEVLGGWQDMHALITFGTPYRGSLNALDSLSNGVRKLLGVLDLTELSRSFTSIHQLLPIYPCYVEDGGSAVRLKEAAQVPGVEKARIAAADEFHREIQRAVERNESVPEYVRARYPIHPVIGLEQPTLQGARLVAGKVELVRERDGQDESGDGTVPRVSASPIEAGEESAIFAATRHASLQNADAVLVHVRGVLTSPAALGRLMAAAPTTISLDVDDVYLRHEPVSGTVAVSDAGEDVVVEIEDAAGGGVFATRALPRSDDPQRSFEFAPLGVGTYRIRVSGDPARVEPVVDLLVVA